MTLDDDRNAALKLVKQADEVGRVSGREPWREVLHRPETQAAWVVQHEGRSLRMGDHLAENTPAADCECGLRAMTSLVDFLAGINHPHWRRRMGLGPYYWARIGGPAYALSRALGGVAYLPDVIGEGNVENGAPWDDPPGTLRVQYARPGWPLFVAHHVTCLVPRIQANYPDARVVITSQQPHGWLTELAETGGSGALTRAP
ncbi:hypothetical protein AB0K21_43730 [Streptosporangium sp. NPDC049248]|uniref:hypothetical protein n=1 Tax=Streptosporangium sp. NPDC049248 TaxID=3155651 RepID=UPI00341ECDDC